MAVAASEDVAWGGGEGLRIYTSLDSTSAMWAMPAARPLRASVSAGVNRGSKRDGCAPVLDEGAQLLRVGIALAQRLQAHAHVLGFLAKISLLKE